LNGKTGTMVQVWILYCHVNPAQAITLRLDEKIFIDCPHRSTGHADPACYVELKAPLAIWDAYQRGIYPRLDADEYAKVFGSRQVRFGAYGEPY
jgi:hypothetical protein